MSTSPILPLTSEPVIWSEITSALPRQMRTENHGKQAGKLVAKFSQLLKPLQATRNNSSFSVKTLILKTDLYTNPIVTSSHPSGNKNAYQHIHTYLLTPNVPATPRTNIAMQETRHKGCKSCRQHSEHVPHNDGV